ncbi:GNAT family acetyltransferase [Glutamicibacter halophytocola]|uniref:GNAT family N-acetyltransferase n=1 Tax=Glutamicibacter halophytocola TaxID=1933880 RepID=UPI0006D4BC04|nr:GNAT family protein [Glutamicibacter halophytocola]ALG29566.1 GNAT family acetyltransferase [Glutamicibacter halophytocola]
MFFSRRASQLVPELGSDRLLLRQLTMRDETEWINLRYANAQWLSPWDPTSPMGPPESMTYRQMIAGKDEAARDGTGYSWAIVLPQLHQSRPPLIGQVSLSAVQYGAARTASIGYWIDRNHAGFGLMPEACALVVDHCFDDLQLHRLEINIRPENAPSLRVVEKLGFRDEGVRRAYLHIDGAWRDHRTFALNREELSSTMLERIYERKA